MRRRVVFLPIVVTAVILLSLFYMWHNNGQHKLQRCIQAQKDHFYSTSEGQELHRQGTDPPEGLFVLECNQMGFH